MYKIFLVFLGFVMFTSTQAQLSAFTMPSFELPLSFPDDPKYKPSMGIKIGVFKDFEKSTFGISIGFHAFAPKEKSITKTKTIIFGFQYQETQEYGNINYIPILLEWNINLVKNNKHTLYTGFNFGVMIFNYSHKAIRFDSIAKDEYITNKTDAGVNTSVKLGLKWKIKKQLSFFIETAINLHIEELQYYSDPFETNGYMTTLVYSSSTGVGISYYFDKLFKTSSKTKEWLVE